MKSLSLPVLAAGLRHPRATPAGCGHPVSIVLGIMANPNANESAPRVQNDDTDGVEIQYGFTHTDAYRHTQTHANTWRRAWATEGLHLPQGRGGGDLEVGDVL